MRYETPQRALKRLQATVSPSIKPLLEQDELGNTILHQAARGRVDNLKFDQVTNTLEEEATTVMAKIVNSRGMIPVELAELHLSRGDPIRAKIAALTRKHQSRSLHELINLNEVMTRYEDKNISKTLHENLVLGVAVVNMVRDLKLESSTHPQVNSLLPVEQSNLYNKIQTMRKESEKERNYLRNEAINESKETRFLAYLETQKSTAIKHGVANCAEYTMIAMFYLLTYGYKKDILSLTLKNADHEMALIGNLEDENAVVCDAHAGEIYPLREINDHATGCMYKLSYDFGYRGALDWITQTSYDSRAHKIEAVRYPYF